MTSLRGIDLEIVEEVRTPRSTPPGVDIVMPDRVRINGMEMLGPAGTAIRLEAADDGGVLATLTLFCRTVRVGTDYLVPDDVDPPFWAELAEAQGDPLQTAVTMKGYVAASTMAMAAGRLA